MGGASRYVCELAQALNASYDVLVAAGGAGELFDRCSASNIRTVTIPHLERDIGLVREVKVFLFLLSLFNKEKPDIVHLNSPKAGGLGALAARLVGIKKIIYTAHGWAFYEERPWWAQSLIRAFSCLTVHLATKTIAVSEKDARAFAREPFMKNKVVRVPIGVTQRSVVTREAARNALGIAHDVFVVGAIGELHRNKGYTYLIEAAREVPDTTFVILGDGEERKNLETLIAKNNLHDRVILKGYVPNATDYLAAFDLFALPSTKEGLPYVLLEAGMQGLPVVASNVGGIPDVIGHDKTGLLVPAKDPAALAAAIKRLQASPSLASTLSSALQSKVSHDFSFSHMIQQTTALY